MASEDVKRSESAAVSTIVNLAEEAREGVKAPSYAVLSICKSLFAGGVAGGCESFFSSSFLLYMKDIDVVESGC